MHTPPQAERRPHEITQHGDTRVDPYYWLMDRESDEVRRHLDAENAYRKASLAHLAPLEQTIFEEIKSRVVETDTSVPVRKDRWWYFERTTEGLDYPASCRVPVIGDGVTPPVVTPGVALPNEQVILDENVEAAGHDFLSVGVVAVSPDDAWVAVGTDFEGNERHRVTFRSLVGTAPLSDVLDDVYYGFAWANDSRHVFYTKVDATMRPWQLWRHELGTTQSDDVVVHQEDDPQYFISVGRTRDDRVIQVVLNSSMTTEVRWIDADEPHADFAIIDERRHGIEYAVEHYVSASGERFWVKTTNEDAMDFRLMVRRVSDDTWREVIAHREGTRLDGVDAFAGYLVASERLDGSAVVRVIPLVAGSDPFAGDLLANSLLVANDVVPSTTLLLDTPSFETTHVRVVTTSMVTPRMVQDVELATGATTLRKQQVVAGSFEATNYVTCRIWVSASDAQRIPVSVVARRDLVTVHDDGTFTPNAPSPMLLYGYGSYEISMDPSFSVFRLSLLDRGVIFAIAHVRGGGEMGRSWYEMGKLEQKPTTFSDFVRVGRYFVDENWTTSNQFAAQGGSAGGLLMGAVMNLDPELFRAVVAAVPFVDALTTMLDDSLPLTSNEWEEWGNPAADPKAYRTMKSYSPYDNLRDDVVYPTILATGGLNDSRVGFWEPAKWVLALRDRNPKNTVYLKMEMGAGHGGPSGRYEAWRDEANELAFVISQITDQAAS